MATIIKNLRLKVVSGVSSALVKVVSNNVMISDNNVVLAGCVVASGLLVLKHVYLMEHASDQEISQLVDREVEELSAELVTEGKPDVSDNTVGPIVTWSNERFAIGMTSMVQESSDSTDPLLVGAVQYINDPIETKLHRKVVRRHRMKYVNTVVAECKLVFGVPKHSEANYKAVRRVAVKLMKNHGVRPSHINSMLPKIVEMVFMPSCYELEAKRLANSSAAWKRVSEYLTLSGLSPGAWFSGSS